MNPQFAPQHQPYGAPPNRSTPSPMGPPPNAGGNFQTIPLGPSKMPPTSTPLNPPMAQSPLGGHPPQMRSSIPATQLPPSQYGPPPSMKPPQFQNGPPQFQNGPHIQNGPGLGQIPPTSTPSDSIGKPPTSNIMGQQNNSYFPPQSAGPPTFGNPNQAPANQNVPQPPNQHAPPPSSTPSQTPISPPGQQSTPPLSGQQPPPTSQQSQAPFSGQQPPFLGQPQSSFPGQPPSQPSPPGQGHPPISQHSQPPLPGQPHSTMSQPPLPGQSQPPMSQQTFPSMPGQQQQQQPPMSQHSQPPLPGQPPMSQHSQPPLPGQPPMSQPPVSQASMPGPPPMGQPPNQQQHFNPLMRNQYPPNPHLQPQPPMNTTQQPPGLSGPPLPGQTYKPPTQQPMGMPPPTNRMPPSGPGQFNQPPLPGQHPPPQSQYPPPPGSGPNQLANQMQGMNLGSGRYPATKSLNGDQGPPHMPPPMNNQYMNGQQIRGPPAPGYPPMPGQQPPGPGSYPQPAYPQAQQQQPKRLDPDQMPNPIKLTQDDQTNRSGIFYTNQKGLVPPLVTTNFIVQDQGNASPRFIRSTMYDVPISQDIMKQTAVPFSLIISPMARTVDGEYPPPIVDFGELGPVRCIRCKAYMCPFMQFIDSGRRFQCLFCKATTDVPQEYFQHLDHTGQRLDRYSRPELILGTYEFLATTDYCRNNTLPKPPAMIFVIDVSYNSVKSGLVHLLCAQMKEIIQNLPIDQGQEKSNMKIGFITYNSSVHFYNIKGTLAAPQMLVVGDTQEMFMPLLDGFLCTPEESGPIIDALMQQIPTMFGDTRETETILLPAILAGLEALKASDCAGKLLVFTSTLPTAEAPGKLKNRDDRKLLGTDKEKTILTPQTQAYNQLGQDCVASGCSVDLFVFNNAYIDIATIGQVARLTGGEVYKYTYFQADIDGERLIRDIITDISRPIAFDAIMRVRTSTGVRPTDFYGHFYMSNTTDMELASIDCDKAVAVEIKHDDKLSEDEGVYIQTALLYTSCSGQRRLRIINLSLKTCSQMGDLYRSCDCDSIINYISKQATFKLLDNNPKAVKDNIVQRAAQMLATYRKNCASPSSAGQLILPECMKLLPLYVNCVLKSDALSGGADMTVDDRSYVMQQVMIMDVSTSVNYFYPRLIPLHNLDLEQKPIQVPSPIRCTIDKMSDQGVYILENGIHMFLWIGLGASPDFIQRVFGVPSAIQVEIERVTLPELDNPLSLAVRTIIDEIRIQRHRCMRLTIVRQREKLEPVFKHFLAEDRGNDGSPSYVDFLIHMHKEIRALLS